MDAMFSSKDIERQVRLSSGSLSEVEVGDFMKKVFFRPNSIDDAHHQLINLHLVCQFFFGTNAHITTKVGTWPTHMTRFCHVYTSLQNSDRDFATKLVYAVDLRVQKLIASCYNSDGLVENCDFEFINEFSSLQNSIVTRSFNIIVPSALLKSHAPTSTPTSSSKAAPSSGGKRKAVDKETAGQKMAKASLVANPDKSLCLDASEKFGDVFP